MTEDRLRIVTGLCGQLILSGEVDVLSAPRLRRALQQAGPAGGSALVVDLQQVSLMQAAGVTVLFEQAARGRLKIILRSGTATAKVCAVCALGEVVEVEIRRPRTRPAPGPAVDIAGGADPA